MEPTRYQKVGLWQWQDVDSLQGTEELPYEVVYTRHYSKVGMRSVINITATLQDAFRQAITRIQEIRGRVLAGESPHTMQVWKSGKLLALARLYRPIEPDMSNVQVWLGGQLISNASPCGTEHTDSHPLRVHWIRQPTSEQYALWNAQLDIEMSLGGLGFDNSIAEVGAGEHAREILMELLLLERHQIETEAVFKVLYKVEQEMGLSSAIAVHLEDDLGL